MRSKNTLFLPRRAGFALLAALLLINGGCNTLETKIQPPPPEFSTLELIHTATYRQSATVPDNLALDSLVKYLEQYPSLLNLLEGPNNYTLFAPSNKAFKDLLSILPNNIQLDALNTTLLKGMLSYHFVSDIKLKEGLIVDTELSSLFRDPQAPSAPQQIIINSNGTLKTGSANQAIQITSADNRSVNGVVHVVDAVLFPPSTATVFANLTGTMALSVFLLDYFSTLYELIQLADEDFKEDTAKLELKIISWLALPQQRIDPVFDKLSHLLQGSPKSGLTFFAISNQVVNIFLRGKDAFLSEFTPASARGFLLNHLVWGKYELENITNGLVLNTILAGPKSIPTAPTTLTVVKEDPNRPLNPLGISLKTQRQKTAPIATQLMETSNGVIYLINGSLPPD